MIQRVLMAVAIAGYSIGIVAAAQAPTKTTNDGVYTADQAARGKAVFESKCTGCHEPSRFMGDTFYEAWDGKPMKEIWDIASGTMPEDNPGSLKQQEYGDILAYSCRSTSSRPATPSCRATRRRWRRSRSRRKNESATRSFSRPYVSGAPLAITSVAAATNP
jgi:mono/diheme cytochrome c family protein